MSIEYKYWDNETIKCEIPLDSQGKKHGVERHWYKNGQRYNEIPYHHGDIHGITRFWLADGTFNVKYYYLDDIRTTQKEYEAACQKQ